MKMMKIDQECPKPYRGRSGSRAAYLYAGAVVLSLTGCGDTEPVTVPAGEEMTTETLALDVGATILQSNPPLDSMNVYLVGFHPMKDDPTHQIEAHHFCSQVNEEFAQCALFDGNTRNANLNGIEYIISERLFETLPEEERQYWHPHNYEILSGQLVAPGIPDFAEKQLMAGKMNSYGKTWHLWQSGSADVGGNNLPLGEPMLGWSFNRDGEAYPGMLQMRDQRMGIDSASKRETRGDLQPLANPQSGVDALLEHFPDAAGNTMPGVVDKNSQPVEPAEPLEAEPVEPTEPAQ